MRIISLSAFSLLLMLSFGGTTLACDCLTLDPQQSFKEAAVVFEGELIRSSPINNVSPLAKTLTYTFAVSRVLKGPSAAEVTLVGGQSNCDFFFFPDTVYRVYARRSDGELFTGSCLANQVLRSKKISGHVGYQTAYPWHRWSNKAIVGGIAFVTLPIVWFLARGLRPKKLSLR